MSPDLQAAMTAANSGMWSIVIDRLQSIPSADTTLQRQQILDLALQVLIDGDFEEQWAIAKIIPKLGEIALQPLLEIINDTDIDLDERWFVARILGEFKQPEVAIALVSVLQLEEDAELRAMITGALGQIGTPAIAALTSLLPTPSRPQAIAALAQIRHSQTIEPLLATIDDADPQLRATIVEALGSFQDPRIPPMLLERLTDVSARVRKAAVIALTLRANSGVGLDLVDRLRPLLSDLDLDVCVATALGLARLGDPQVVEILTTATISPHLPDVLRSAIILGLGWIGCQRAIASLAQMLATSPPDRAREIIVSIGKTDTERVYASQQLVMYLEQGTSVEGDLQLTAIVKQEIVATLGNLGNIDVVPHLSQLLRDPDDRVRLQTISTIAKLSESISTPIV
jgi:HEAT repeat protein